MILAVDVGNTNIVMGVFKDEELICHLRLETDSMKTTDEYAALILLLLDSNNVDRKGIKGVIISSVVPQIVYTINKFATKYLGVEPLVVGPGLKTGVSIKMENPKEVGADRIVNAAAAKFLYGFPCLVVDFGTATTIDVIDERGDYVGGIISPGVKLSAQMLKSKTAKLPEVEIEQPETVTGKNTIHSIKSGIFYGYLSMIDGLIKRIIDENNFDVDKINVIATGGLGRIFTPASEYIEKHDPYLTLTGLREIYEKNS